MWDFYLMFWARVFFWKNVHISIIIHVSYFVICRFNVILSCMCIFWGGPLISDFWWSIIALSCVFLLVYDRMGSIYTLCMWLSTLESGSYAFFIVMFCILYCFFPNVLLSLLFYPNLYCLISEFFIKRGPFCIKYYFMVIKFLHCLIYVCRWFLLT